MTEKKSAKESKMRAFRRINHDPGCEYSSTSPTPASEQEAAARPKKSRTRKEKR